MKLYLSRPLPDRVVAAASEGFDLTVRQATTPMTKAEMHEALAEADVIMPTLGDMFSAPVFAAAAKPRARLLANFGVGYNHIDVEAARAAGLEVTNTPGAVTDATADIALTLMLMTARRAGEGERLVRAGLWEGWHPTQLLGLHMTGKVLGVIGMGRIGQAIAKRAHFGFGMQVLYHTRTPRPLPDLPDARALPRLIDVMAAADIVVLAIPATPTTHHMIDADALAAMRPQAHLVNISRGDVIDEAALIDALRARRIAGAGLDVYEHEPQVPEALRAMENVVLLPHLGTAALEVREAMGLMVLENARAFRDGRALPNVV
ncbi:D-glycerate dehydrogenase [Pararhodobacter sp. SW119]|uniref:2-hydroxyacid dehydrogenase n=1 Tax=Pararhodobacter sp. SW119 TaxID=2780075 RepID=UPI001AE031D6|nr:D-glycerate dehydrogenase [Pararhodobacter sp. SW119]